METVAVYWEPIIRTYGFEVRKGLTMVQLALHPDGGGDLDLLPQGHDVVGGSLIMATAQRSSDSSLAVWVVVDGVVAQDLRDRAPDDNGPTVTYPVEVVCFHGPHFGDRYGIASAALSVLAQDKVEVLLTGCTSASIFLTVGHREGQRTVKSLQRAFTTPERPKPAGESST